MQKLFRVINDNSTGSIHANMAGKASFFNGIVWFNINFSRFYCVNSKLYAQTITLGWIIDSGANQHLTVSIVVIFNIVDITSLKITVGHPNGTLATISHVENLKLSTNMILYDVLVVPGYCVSLLSVNKLTRDRKMFVGFDENKCYIQDLKLVSHFKAALRVLRYLKGSPGCGIQFNNKYDLKLMAFVDADWAMIRKSVTASYEIICLGNLLHSLGLKSLYHVDLCCDNSSSIQVAANPVFHERTKHFKLNVYFVREKVMAGIIKTVKVDTKVQVADIFTKCLGVVQHSLFCKKLGLLDIFAGIMTSNEKRRIQSKKKVQTEGG
nr:ribonuclease H-like domain-containing protein [Tanacetum cinerariifolium]